jgi:hypothetical protein
MTAAAAASQMVLPPFARSRIADRLGDRVGDVRSVDVAATPAVKLLWGHADRVDLHLGDVDAGALGGGGGRLATVDDVDVRVDDVATPVGDVEDVHLRKSGDAFDADALLAADAAGGALQPQVGSDGTLLMVTPGGLRLRVTAADGAIVARPESAGLLGSLVGSRSLFAPDWLRFERLRAVRDGSAIRLAVSGHTAT